MGDGNERQARFKETTNAHMHPKFIAPFTLWWICQVWRHVIVKLFIKKNLEFTKKKELAGKNDRFIKKRSTRHGPYKVLK